MVQRIRASLEAEGIDAAAALVGAPSMRRRRAGGHEPAECAEAETATKRQRAGGVGGGGGSLRGGAAEAAAATASGAGAAAGGRRCAGRHRRRAPLRDGDGFRDGGRSWRPGGRGRGGEAAEVAGEASAESAVGRCDRLRPCADGGGESASGDDAAGRDEGPRWRLRMQAADRLRSVAGRLAPSKEAVSGVVEAVKPGVPAPREPAASTGDGDRPRTAYRRRRFDVQRRRG